VVWLSFVLWLSVDIFSACEVQYGGSACACVERRSLFFLLCKYGTVPVKLLKSALLDFYSENVIWEAKVGLLDDIELAKKTFPANFMTWSMILCRLSHFIVFYYVLYCYRLFSSAVS